MLVYIKLLATALFWGGTFVAGRIAAQGMGPFSAAFLRFAVATVCMWALSRRFEGGIAPLRRADVLPALLLGMTGVFAYNALFFAGLKTVPAGRASVIVACNPVVIALGAALFFREGMTWLRAGGILLSLTGAALAISHGAPARLFEQGLSFGDLCIVGCVASWAAYSLLGKASMRRLSPHAAVAYSCLFGALALAVPAFGLEHLFFNGRHYAWPVWASIAYLGVFGTVLGFTWYYQGVKNLGASRAAVFINFVPIFAILSGYALLGEALDVTLLAGAALVILGAWITNRRPR